MENNYDRRRRRRKERRSEQEKCRGEMKKKDVRKE